MPADKPKPVVVRGWVGWPLRAAVTLHPLKDARENARVLSEIFGMEITYRPAVLTVEPKARKRGSLAKTQAIE